jgi:hypothetical protein
MRALRRCTLKISLTTNWIFPPGFPVRFVIVGGVIRAKKDAGVSKRGRNFAD